MYYLIKLQAVGLLLLSLHAHAAIITQNGTNITFTYDDSTLYGTGTVVGNSISFKPTTFKAESLDGAGFDTLSETLTITLEAISSSYLMNMIQLVEIGDYRLDGGPVADVDVSAYVDIESATTSCGLFACQDTGNIFTAGPLADSGGALTSWGLGGIVDLADTSGWGSDTKIIMTLQNNLLAYTSSAGELAFIQKKGAGVGVQVNPVPIPAALWLFGSGLIGLIGIARRKKA